jgi:hypothetical protein
VGQHYLLPEGVFPVRDLEPLAAAGHHGLGPGLGQARQGVFSQGPMAGLDRVPRCSAVLCLTPVPAQPAAQRPGAEAARSRGGGGSQQHRGGGAAPRPLLPSLAPNHLRFWPPVPSRVYRVHRTDCGHRTSELWRGRQQIAQLVPDLLCKTPKRFVTVEGAHTVNSGKRKLTMFECQLHNAVGHISSLIRDFA